MCFLLSSRRRHTMCALVTGVQTCALPICPFAALDLLPVSLNRVEGKTAKAEIDSFLDLAMTKLLGNRLHLPARIMNILGLERFHDLPTEIGRASCRERVCQYV